MKCSAEIAESSGQRNTNSRRSRAQWNGSSDGEEGCISQREDETLEIHQYKAYCSGVPLLRHGLTGILY